MRSRTSPTAEPRLQEAAPKVLLVDDAESNLVALEAILRDLGADVLRASSAAQALETLLREPVALILLDLRMPGMDGFETAALIRKRDASRDVPIIFITGYEARNEDLTRAYALGAVDFVVKPVLPEILRAKVAVFLELTRKTDELRRQALRLRANEFLLTEAEKMVHLGSWEWNPATGTLRWSEALFRLFGENPETFAPTYESYLARVHPDDRERVRTVVEQTLRERGTFDHFERIFLPDGTVRVLHSRGRTLVDPSTRQAVMIGTCQDVSEEKEREERVRKLAEAEASRERKDRTIRRQLALLDLAKSDLADSAGAFARITETGAHVLDVERVGVWLFAPDRSAIVCRDLYRKQARAHEAGMTLLARDYPRYFQALEESRVVAADDACADPRTSEFTPGYLRPLGIGSMMDVPVRRHGKVVGIVCHEHVGPPRPWTPEDQEFAGSVADLVSLSLEAAERRRAEDEVRRLNETLERRVQERTVELQELIRELEAFTYSVSHDLRAPLRALCSFGEILGHEYSGRVLDAAGQDYARRIAQAARRMDALTQDLLSYSRLGRLDLRLRSVEPATIVANVRASMEHEIRERQAELQVDGRLPGVLADPVLLTQALANLVSNGLKFVRPGTAPRVTVRGERRGDRVVLSVVDNGIGIAPEYQERIFHVFERLGKSEEFPGTGIGLAIVRRAVQRMGGSVGVQSAPDRGSRFWIELEAAAPA
jgi:PAS domain S-box-containing protein